MLGEIQAGALGVDAARVVPLSFHVDDFNDPWKDPFSDPRFSRREFQYSLTYRKERRIEKADTLYFTPMLMVDGREPMLGKDREKARRALAQALARPPGVRIGRELKAGRDAEPPRGGPWP